MNTITCTVDIQALGLPIEMPVEVSYEFKDIIRVRLCGEQITDRLDGEQMEDITRQVFEYEGYENTGKHP